MPETPSNKIKESLTKSKHSPLLIEIQKQLADELSPHSSHKALLNLCQEVYDDPLKNKLTNVIVVNAITTGSSQIMTAVFNTIHHDLKKKIGLDGAIRLFSFIGVGELSSVFAGHMSDMMGTYINDIVDNTLGDFLSDYSANKVQQAIGSKAEEGAVKSATHISDKLTHSKNLQLSKAAKQALLLLNKDIAQSATVASVLDFALATLNAITLDSPKLIIVNNPLHLDIQSFALLTKLFSEVKDNFANSHNHAGMSVVFNYTNGEAFDEASHVSPIAKDTLINFRRFIQRYNLLQKPGKSVPVPAISPDLFVGRTGELTHLCERYASFMAQLQHAEVKVHKSQWTLIQGEPGTGKTALAHAYIQANKNAQQIQLSLANQTGYSASVVGLASILRSLGAEYKRLQALNNAQYGDSLVGKSIAMAFKYKNDFVESLYKINAERKHGRIDGLFDECAKLLGHVSNTSGAIDGLKSSYKAFNIKANNQYQLNALSNADTGAANEQKHQQFAELVSIIDCLKRIVRCIDKEQAKQPLLLFIDDVQWIDETSAEFIMTHLLPAFSMQVLITAREADSIASYEKALKFKDIAPCKLALFNYLALHNNKHLSAKDTPANINEMALNAFEQAIPVARIFLAGMNRAQINDLMLSAYTNINEAQAAIISQAILNGLVIENAADADPHVVTLFAVETLNLISDPRFYTHTNITPLFNQGQAGKFALQEQDETKIAERMQLIMQHLQRDVHRLSFEHESQQTKAGNYFTLASYAVMEERLSIISDYFNEYGDAAAFSLQLSAVMGSPFDSDMVFSIINSFRQVEDQSLQSFASLMQDITKYSQDLTSLEFLTEIEDVFVLVRKVQDLSNRYAFRHSLFPLFFKMNLQHRLSTLLPKLKAGDEEKATLAMALSKAANLYLDEKSDHLIKKRAQNDYSFATINELDFVLRSKVSLSEFLNDFARSEQTAEVYLHHVYHLANHCERLLNYNDALDNYLEMVNLLDNTTTISDSTKRKFLGNAYYGLGGIFSARNETTQAKYYIEKANSYRLTLMYEGEISTEKYLVGKMSEVTNEFKTHNNKSVVAAKYASLLNELDNAKDMTFLDTLTLRVSLLKNLSHAASSPEQRTLLAEESTRCARLNYQLLSTDTCKRALVESLEDLANTFASSLVEKRYALLAEAFLLMSPNNNAGLGYWDKLYYSISVRLLILHPFLQSTGKLTQALVLPAISTILPKIEALHEQEPAIYQYCLADAYRLGSLDSVPLAIKHLALRLTFLKNILSPGRYINVMGALMSGLVIINQQLHDVSQEEFSLLREVVDKIHSVELIESGFLDAQEPDLFTFAQDLLKMSDNLIPLFSYFLFNPSLIFIENFFLKNEEQWFPIYAQAVLKANAVGKATTDQEMQLWGDTATERFLNTSYKKVKAAHGDVTWIKLYRLVRQHFMEH